eukprot:scpid37917/ scgid29061/ Ribosomal protein S6 kinase delta-1; 52 kDa ribosomal protein S6 kinase; Ribosomal S6 kinase-like protein with two PSK domains 118 kDa protein; SPHK1-binding protein
MAETSRRRTTSSLQLQRFFDVVETRRAPQGHTVYKVVFSAGNSDNNETLSEVFIWRRYSTFVQLHKQLEEVYSGLPLAKRSQKFPDFPKATFFGRFDEAVIDERRKGAISLLRFVSSIPELLVSGPLTEFVLHTGEISKSSWEAIVNGTAADEPLALTEEARFQPSIAPVCDGGNDQVSVPDTNDLTRSASTAALTIDDIGSQLPDLSAPVTNGAVGSGGTEHTLSGSLDRCSADVTDSARVAMPAKPTSSDITAAAAGEPDEKTSIWEHKCASPVLDMTSDATADADADVVPPTSGARVSEVSDTESSLGTHAGTEDDGEAIPQCSGGTVEAEEDECGGDGSSALLADLSMIDDQLERGEDPESTAADDQAAGADDLPSGLATPQSISEPHSPSEPASPSLGLSPNRPVARIYASPGNQAGGWFKDVVAASWDDIERRLGDGNSPNPALPPTSQQPGIVASSGTADSTGGSPSSNDRVHPVAELSNTTPSTSHLTAATYRQERSTSIDSISNLELSGDGDYVLQSAAVIGKALEAEAACDFGLAFSLYKSGVGLLLSGVQTDGNALRRDAVRRKTAQYLQRAETLHHRYLKNGAGTNKDRWQGTPRHSSPSASAVPVAQPSAAHHVPSLQLKDFTVIRPLGTLLLAQNCHTQDVYVIKTLNKTVQPAQPSGKRSRRVKSRNLMNTLCPYMVRPVGHFDTPNRLFLLLEYAQRGALWSALERFYKANEAEDSSPPEQESNSICESDEAGTESKPQGALSPGRKAPVTCSTVPESRVRRWAAQIVSALHHLHRHGFVWKDLQPRNLLLDEQDDVLLTYNGYWENVDPQFSLWARENLYTAPELNGLDAATEAADWWSLGAILYELLTGQTLLSCHPAGVSSHSCLYLPVHLSFQASSLLQNLLQPSAKERLGAGHSGIEEIKSHPFFAGVLWTSSR